MSMIGAGLALPLASKRAGNLRALSSRGSFLGSVATIVLTRVLSDGPISLQLAALTLRGQDILPLVTDPISTNLADTPAPGALTGSNGQVVSGLIEPLEVGEVYALAYRVEPGADPGATLYVPENAGSPFVSTPLAITPGYHFYMLEAQDGDTAAVMRKQGGNVTISYFDVQKAQWSVDLSLATGGVVADDQLAWSITSGDLARPGVAHFPEAGAIYVDPFFTGLGSGAFSAPFRTMDEAFAAYQPGDTIYMRPGTYAPFTVPVTGTALNPVEITTLPGEERLAIVEGDLGQHLVYGGPGIVASNATRDGIYVVAQDHVHIRNLTIRNVWRSGIFIVGAEGEQHSGFQITGCRIYNTGSSGISVQGQNSADILPLAEAAPGFAQRIDDVLIEYNDISQTNVVTDYNNNTSNPQGVPGGVAEAITVATGTSNAITRFNDVHDTRQYGIDYKAGVRGGSIYGNRIWNVERYGIYLDTGRRFVEDINVYNNDVWGCTLGIVLTREAGSNTIDYDTFKASEGAAEFVQALINIQVFNNQVWDIEEAGIFCQRHPQKDGPDGEITNVWVMFNTVYNANRRGTARDLNLSGWADADFEAAGVVTDFRFIGNIVWNSTAALAVLDEFTGQLGFAVTENLIGIDPAFADVDATPPDLSLAFGSAALGVVTTPGIVVAPMDQGRFGATRSVPAHAGAVAADPAGEAPESNESFSENAVLADGGAYFTGGTLASDRKAMLLFFSGTSTADTRQALLSWNGYSDAIYADSTGGDGFNGIRYNVDDDQVGSLGSSVNTVAVGTRYHVLLSVWTDDNETMFALAWLYDTGQGAWVQVAQQSDGTNAGATLALSTNPIRVLNRTGNTSHGFTGSVNRLALWTATAGAPIADIDDAAIRDQFASGSTIVDPAVSQAALAASGVTLEVDLNGAADNYNAGTHDGAQALLVSGAFA